MLYTYTQLAANMFINIFGRMLLVDQMQRKCFLVGVVIVIQCQADRSRMQ